MAVYPDGTRDVYCRICTKHLGRFQDLGFSSAICIECQEAQKQLEENKLPQK